MLIIDGHNLIPKVAGLALDDPNDEDRLGELLREYARLRRKQVLVFFDKASPGRTGERSYGTVRAVFVSSRTTADDAIARYLRGMSKGARRQARVVSSDRQVQAEAREQGVGVIESEDFARELAPPVKPAARAAAAPPDQKTDPQDWYGVFGIDPEQAEREIKPETPKKAKQPRPRSRHGFPRKEP